MFSPMTAARALYKTFVGPSEEEDEDGTKREDAGEKEDSGSDSDGGTSADPPGLRDSLKHTPAGDDTEVRLQESEIIAADTAAEVYTVRTEEFSARLSALPLGEIVDDDEEEVTTGDIIPGDGSGASKDSDGRVITLPEDIRTVINPAVKSAHDTVDGKDRTADYELPELDSEQDKNAQLNNDLGDRMLQQDNDSYGDIEQDQREGNELELDSDSNSDTDSSSNTSDETMSTVRENTESCQLESEDRNEFGEGDDSCEENSESWPSEDEEHIYIAPDLEFPFYQTNVELEQTINVEELLENLDKKIVLEPPKPDKERYSPRPISNEELDNALKILRSGKPQQKRSWFSLDNVSSSKPNRSFALCYGERRNSAGDDNEPSSPEGNGIVFSLTGISKDKHRSHSADEHLGEMENYIPSELSVEDLVFPRPASAPKEFSLDPEQVTWRDDNPYTPSDEHFIMATPQSPPETIADDGHTKLRPVSPLDSNQFPTTNEDPAMPVAESAPYDHYNPFDKHREDEKSYIPNTPLHEDAAYPGQESNPEETPYQHEVSIPPYDGTYSPRAQADAIPETFASDDPPLPSPISPSSSNDDAALPDPQFAPEPITFATPSEPRSEPHPELVHQPPTELHSGSPSPTELPQEPTSDWALPSAPETTPNLHSDVHVKFASEFVENPKESNPVETPYHSDVKYPPYDGTYSPRTQSPRADAFPGPESIPETFASDDPPLPSPISPSSLNDDVALPDPRFAPEPITFATPSEPRSEPHPELVRQPPTELHTSSPSPTELPQEPTSDWALPSALKTTPNLHSDVHVKFASEFDENPEESNPVETPYQPDVKYPPYDGTYSLRAQPPRADAFPGPESIPETFASVDPPLPSHISSPGLTTDVALRDSEFAPEPTFAAPLEPRSEPHSELVDQPPTEWQSSSPPPRTPFPAPTSEWSQPSAAEATPLLVPNVDDGFPSKVDENPDEFPPPPPVDDDAYIPNDKFDDLPPPPEDISVPHDQVNDEVNDEILEPEDSPMSPEPYISASIKHPKVFYPPSLQTHPQDVEHEQFPRQIIHEQRPVFLLKQKESALSEIENILPVKKTYPTLPPKPNLQKQKAVTETTIRSSSVTEEKTPVDLSSLDSNQPDEVAPDESPMSPEPYISASVKLPSVFSMPQFESPVSSKAEPSYRGNIIEHEQFPVFSNVNRELAFAELENIVPKRKVPPPVPPKPRFKRQKIVEPELVSTGVAEVECPIDFSRLDQKDQTNDITPDPEFVSEKPLPVTVEESYGTDETTTQDDVIIEAGISVHREESQEIYHVPGRQQLVTQAESLQIPDAGDLSYIPRDETTPPEDEVPIQSQDGVENRSLDESTRETVRINARLSLHRMESGEQFTETVISIQEQEIKDEDQQMSSSDSEEEVSVLASTTGRNEDEDELFGSERYNDDGTFSTEDNYHPSAALPEAFESFPGASAPAMDSNSDHFESPEFSSADEFVAEADIAIRKMSAAKNAHHLKEITSSSSSSSDDSSASSDSDDSSYESAEEHTYIVTESGEGFEEEDDNQGYGVVSRPLPQVIEEGEEEEEEEGEEEEEEYEEEKYSHDAYVDDNQEKEEEIKEDEPIGEQEGDEQIEHEDERVEHMNTKSSDDEAPYEQHVTISLEATRDQPEELPDSEIPNVTPTEKPRYPKYINYDRPMYENKPGVGAEYDGSVEQIFDLPHKTAEGSPPLRKSPEMLETTIPGDEHEGSESSNESDTSEESSDSSQDNEEEEQEEEDEEGSDEREYREQTMDFSSEYSDEPEWLPPPPSTGARVFVLTSNMPYPVKVEPRPAPVVLRQHYREDEPQFYEPRFTDTSSIHSEQNTDETKGDTVSGVMRKEDDEDYNKSEEELESDQYFRPITEVAPSASKSNLEETARPIPQYTTEETHDSPQSVTSAPENAPEVSKDSIAPGEQKSNAQDVKSVTITYTVIHTKPLQDGTRDVDGNTSSDSLPQDAPASDDRQHPKDEGMEDRGVTDKSIPQSNSYQRVLKSEDFPEYASDRPYRGGPPSNGFTESPTEYSETIQPVNAAVVESSPPSGPREPSIKQRVGGSLPPYETDLDKYEFAYRSSAATEPEVEREPEASSEYRPDVAPDESWKHSSKSIPVNEVGPYNYTSHPDQPRENRHDSRETTVKKIELRPEVSLFTISPREQSIPHEKPTSPDAAASSLAGDTGDTGPYRYSSWYEEPKDDTPAMAIALVKSDIRLPPEYISERKTAEKPKPKPKPKERPRGPGERLEDGEYSGIRVMWYDEPTEEKPNESDDVIIISSVEPQEESQPKEETPLSPEVEPGTYKYSAWYEEPAEEPTGDNYFAVSRPATEEDKSKSDTARAPVSPEKGPGRYKFSAWYDEPPEEPSKEDYFVLSAPSANEDTSKPASSSTRNREEIFKEGLSRSALYEHYQSQKPATEDPSVTFVISRPYEEVLRPPDEGTRSTKSTADDLYYPQEAGIDRNVKEPSGNSLSVEGNVSGTSSRNNSYGSSRTSGSLADVSATSGEAMRRTWSDDSDEFRNGKDSTVFEPPAVQRVTKLPPQPKPRKGKPSAPSSSDDEQQNQQPRRPGRSDKRVPEAKPDLGENLSPRDEYALASSSWRRIPVEEPRPPQESAIWDSGDDRLGRTRPGNHGVHDNRYSVPEKPRKEIEQMLDSLVDDEDAFNRPQTHGRVPQLPPQRLDDAPAMGRWRNDGTRSMNLLPQTQSKSYEFVETSFQESRFQSTSESHIPRGFDEKEARGRHPDFAQPITVLRPRGNEPSRMPETRPDNKRLPEGRGRQPVPRDDGNDGPPSSRDEYRLAAASWENMSSASDEGPFKRTKMETWDNDPDAGPTQTAYPAALISKQSHQPERAPGFSEEAYAPPRGPRGKGNGMVVTADVHVPYVPPPVPGDPQLAVQMLSVSSSTAELAPPPPTDWGTPRKAYSTLAISQLVPRQPNMEVIIPDAEASVPRRHHRSKGRGPHPPTSGPRSGRSHSPVSIASYSSTQSLPARILPRLPRDNELEKLKQHIAEIGKLTEIKSAELRKLYRRNPSVRHHIPMRGPRGELISPDGRVLSTPEKPNRAELEKYKRFFDKLPEPHFRRLMHEMLEYKHMVKQKEEEIRRLNTQYVGLRKRLAQLAQQGK